MTVTAQLPALVVWAEDWMFIAGAAADVGILVVDVSVEAGAAVEAVVAEDVVAEDVVATVDPAESTAEVTAIAPPSTTTPATLAAPTARRAR